MTIVVNKELAMRLENSEIDTLFSRLTAIKEISRNPMGVEIQRFGNATAFSVKNIPGPSFNTVKGLTDHDARYVDKIVNFYNQMEIPVRFELTPAHVSSDLLTYLNKLGFYQLDFHTSLYKTVELKTMEEIIEPEISIRELKNDEFDTFAEIYTKGFQMPAFLKRGVAQNNKILYNNKNWTFYLASIDNSPAGIGVLFTKDRIATLAAATTIPSLRRNGIHSVLIKKRMYQASLEECDLIVGQAKFGSISQNNMERMGMRIAYTKSIWVKN
ncbi:GNAT family N-acetyltransferase [Gracilibacillus sp. D59]|uniref:GNAT family N-acetyltransferase n=1 Tax=Gracilibacillus sp. D59 TaxID=3457434 RepID=UPI003FCC59EC